MLKCTTKLSICLRYYSNDACKSIETVHNMRTQFDFPNAQGVNWFPGHMAKTQRQLVALLKNKYYSLDFLIEIRDARIPFTSSSFIRNTSVLSTSNFVTPTNYDTEFESSSVAYTFDVHHQKKQKDKNENLETAEEAKMQMANFVEELKKREKTLKRLIVFNKQDLADPKLQHQIVDYYSSKQFLNDSNELNMDTQVMFTSVKSSTPQSSKTNVKQLINECIHTLSQDKSQKIRKFNSIPYLFLIAGIPNVGKSSLINALKQQYQQNSKRIAKEGALPGVTRHISGFRICEEPHPCVVMDTPGVMLPNIDSSEKAYKLALAMCIKALGTKKSPLSALAEDSLSDYLLFKMNQKHYFDYVNACGLKEPTDEIDKVLYSLAQKYHLAAHVSDNSLDKDAETLNRAAIKFITLFRDGKLGRITLDELPF